MTRSVRPGAPASSSLSIGAASSNCSKLSSTSSVRRPRRDATSASSGPRSGLSTRPSAPAIVVATRSASLIGASSTSTTPPGNSASRPVVASAASRVFPVPAGPVRVRRRTSAPPSRARISRCSRLRPTKEVDRARSLGAGRASGADRRDVQLRILVEDRPLEAAQRRPRLDPELLHQGRPAPPGRRPVPPPACPSGRARASAGLAGAPPAGARRPGARALRRARRRGRARDPRRCGPAARRGEAPPAGRSHPAPTDS